MAESARVVLVTGGTAGIGRAAALAFARDGARVVVATRNAAVGSAMAAAAQHDGQDVQYLPVDVTDDDQVGELLRLVIHRFGRLDAAFNNAGYGMPRSLLEQTPETWRTTVQTNLDGVWSCLRHEVRAMVEQGEGGAIVNNASMYGLVGLPALSDYTASKHGVVGLTRATALEFASRGIRINAICSGAVDTALLRRQLGPLDPADTLAGQYPLGRLATVAEVAETVVWLCSPSSGFVTGAALAVDGGATAA